MEGEVLSFWFINWRWWKIGRWSFLHSDELMLKSVKSEDKKRV